MTRKLSLEIGALAVESFPTTPARGTDGGTVLGAESDSDVPVPTPPVYADFCTCDDTCLCRTAYYHCGTGPATIHSCKYTYNDSCFVTPNPTPPETLGC